MKIIRSQGLKIFFPFFIQLTNTNLQFPQCSHQEAMGGKHIIISLYYAISACFATSPLYHDKPWEEVIFPYISCTIMSSRLTAEKQIGKWRGGKQLERGSKHLSNPTYYWSCDSISHIVGGKAKQIFHILKLPLAALPLTCLAQNDLNLSHSWGGDRMNVSQECHKKKMLPRHICITVRNKDEKAQDLEANPIKFN